MNIETVRRALARRYTVERQIGRGGMATVFLAQDRERERSDPIAVKVLHPEFTLTLGRKRFQQEINLLRDLQHGSILPLFESGEQAGLLYFTMPYVAGESLRGRLNRDRALPLADVVLLADQIGPALDYCHARNIVHRDVKPENILYDGSRALLCDFGIARAIVLAGGDRLSSSGLIIGTPEYMSAEQAAGIQTLDGRSDIYSLGCVLFEALAGEPPFTGRTPQAVMARHVAERPPSVRVLRPDVTEQIDAAIVHALAKSPGARPGSAGALLEELKR